MLAFWKDPTPNGFDLVAASLVENYKHLVAEFVEQARARFSDVVRPKAYSEISQYRARLMERRMSNAVSYIDFLEGNVDEAFKDVDSWLGLWTTHGDGADFQLSELVQFETTTFIFSDYKRLKVLYSPLRMVEVAGRRVSQRRNEDFRLRGSGFEVFQEIVHNLVSNAYKYSGLDIKTKLEFEFAIDGGDCTVRCTNDFSEARADEIVSKYPEVTSSLREKSLENVGREGLSGFKKIVVVCSRVLEIDAAITVLQPSVRRRHYTVEIRLPNVADRILVDEAHPAS